MFDAREVEIAVEQSGAKILQVECPRSAKSTRVDRAAALSAVIGDCGKLPGEAWISQPAALAGRTNTLTAAAAREPAFTMPRSLAQP